MGESASRQPSPRGTWAADGSPHSSLKRGQSHHLPCIPWPSPGINPALSKWSLFLAAHQKNSTQSIKKYPPLSTHQIECKGSVKTQDDPLINKQQQKTTNTLCITSSLFTSPLLQQQHVLLRLRQMLDICSGTRCCPETLLSSLPGA